MVLSVDYSFGQHDVSQFTEFRLIVEYQGEQVAIEVPKEKVFLTGSVYGQITFVNPHSRLDVEEMTACLHANNGEQWRVISETIPFVRQKAKEPSDDSAGPLAPGHVQPPPLVERPEPPRMPRPGPRPHEQPPHPPQAPAAAAQSPRPPRQPLANNNDPPVAQLSNGKFQVHGTKIHFSIDYRFNDNVAPTHFLDLIIHCPDGDDVAMNTAILERSGTLAGELVQFGPFAKPFAESDRFEATLMTMGEQTRAAKSNTCVLVPGQPSDPHTEKPQWLTQHENMRADMDQMRRDMQARHEQTIADMRARMPQMHTDPFANQPRFPAGPPPMNQPQIPPNPFGNRPAIAPPPAQNPRASAPAPFTPLPAKPRDPSDTAERPEDLTPATPAPPQPATDEPAQTPMPQKLAELAVNTPANPPAGVGENGAAKSAPGLVEPEDAVEPVEPNNAVDAEDSPLDAEVKLRLAELKNLNPRTRRMAAEKLAKIPRHDRWQPQVVEGLYPMLEHPDSALRKAALRALVVWGDASGVKRIAALKNDPDVFVQWGVIEALTPHPGELAAQTLGEMYPDHRQRARDALRKMGTFAEPVLWRLLDNPDPIVRAQVCELLGNVGTARSIKRLEKMRDSGDMLMDLKVNNALATLRARTGQRE